ncbi:zona pellucida-binding protein 1 isoform X2 [Sphaerodactylus townsendi]|uniref:zona pellucida-binding protein 1 isoform X2 n=1 Tax=Sphaerodactylus townsendi TaxID=933632 RepID=UPI002025DD01|nr:zona pellucida-binding protein 1 isoform X2 [Sphaerodactylus townsendi]
MRRRGRRRRRPRPSSVLWGSLSLALILSLGLPSVHCSSNSDAKGLKVVGSTNLPVKVYVKTSHNSPHILCVTNHLRNSELIDPIFQWHGPEGDVVGAYADPKFHYEFTARYHAAPCNSGYNTPFEKKLLQILSKLVVELACEIAILKSECHHVKMQRAGLQNVIFFTFTVSSIESEKSQSMCKKETCDMSRRLRKAKDLIEKFFSQQVEVLGKRTAPLPEIYYIEGTLQMVWVSRCYPGYGINPLLHPDCPHCCVVCSPGSYNPREGVHCLPCNKSLAYGAKTC